MMQRERVEDLLRAAPSQASAGPARLALGATLAAIAWVTIVYWSTGIAIVRLWASSDTFAHGFVVAPIALWLIWRQHAELALARPTPCMWILPLVGVAGSAWLLGELSQINALRQFALVAMIVLAVPAIAGVAVFRTIAFPLAFLFFAVPFGDFLLPQLMDWTAYFTVAALRASGVPVYQEGLQFVIPSGAWSVVEACSGVRYLIASVVVGTLFAYLNYRSWSRRALFVAASFVVPILANWIRAYMIVMLGHLSNNKLAVGVDHLIYGWIFFGIVMLLMFSLGAHWREDDPPPQTSGRALYRTLVAPPGGTVFWSAAGMFGFVAIVPLLVLHAVTMEPAGTPAQLGAIDASGGWMPAMTPLTDWRPRYANPTVERFETFSKNGQQVGLYIGFYRDQSNEHKLVSSSNVLVASNDNRWLRVATGASEFALSEASVSVLAAELRSTTNERLRVWQWFWVDGHFTSSSVLAKAYTAKAQLRGRGDDSAVIIISTPVAVGATARVQADAVLQAFARDASASIDAALRATRDKR